MNGESATIRRRRLPSWLRRTPPTGGRGADVRAILDQLHLATVCHGAKCPNRCECFASGTATFLILGRTCRRGCAFCAVDRGPAESPDPNEPGAIAEAARRLKLRHVVITSVTRDDLPDGGAAHFAATVAAVRRTGPDATIEVLTPDFRGRDRSVDVVCDAGCDVFGHNLETVPRLYPQVRPEADYRRSLGVLVRAGGRRNRPRIKSGLMVGLGETDAEILQTLMDLRGAGCEVVTIGQYLRPTDSAAPVARFIRPRQFEDWKRRAMAMGFSAVASGPWVRSSYRAEDLHAAGSARP